MTPRLCGAPPYWVAPPFQGEAQAVRTNRDTRRSAAITMPTARPNLADLVLLARLSGACVVVVLVGLFGPRALTRFIIDVSKIPTGPNGIIGKVFDHIRDSIATMPLMDYPVRITILAAAALGVTLLTARGPSLARFLNVRRAR